MTAGFLNALGKKACSADFTFKASAKAMLHQVEVCDMQRFNSKQAAQFDIWSQAELTACR